MNTFTVTRTLIASFISVNTLFGANVASASPPELDRDECYVLIGRGLFEDGTFYSVEANEEGFAIHVNEEVWSNTHQDVKKVVQDCLDLIITVKPELDEEREPWDLEVVL